MRRRLAALAAAAVVVAGLGAAPVAAGAPKGGAPLSPRVVTTFDPGPLGSFAESLARDSQGALYASVTDWMPDGVPNTGQVWRIGRDGRRTAYGPSIDTEGGLLSGLVFGDDGALYVGVITFTSDPAPGVVRIDSNGNLTRVLDLPDWTFPNGLAFHAGYLYVSDSTGAIWRVRPRTGVVETQTEPWLADPLLAPQTGWEGINGIAFLGNNLFGVNADTGTVVRIPVDRSGAPGEIAVVATAAELQTADGVAFDASGRLWVAVNLESGGRLARVATDGSVTVVVDDPGWLDYPSQIVFGADAGHTLYVENGSLNAGAPSIVAIDARLTY